MSRELPSIEPGTGRDGRAGVLVRMPFTPRHEQLREQLKEMVPAADRYWWPEADAWWVGDGHQDVLEFVLLRFWPSLHVLSGDEGDDYLVDRMGVRAAQTRLL